MPDFDAQDLSAYFQSILAPGAFFYLTDDQGNFLTTDDGVFLIVEIEPEPEPPVNNANPQPGQKYLQTGLPGIVGVGGTGVDNGGAVFTELPLGGGTVTLTGATPVPVADSRVKANSIIVYTVITPAGTVSPTSPNTLTKTPGIGFTVGGAAGDTSLYGYGIIG